MVRILFLGDVFGRPGRRVLSEHLHELCAEFKPALTIANGENCAGGLGIDPVRARELFDAGVQVITTGNHVWSRKELRPLLDQGVERLIRPDNFPAGAPGRGWTVFETEQGCRIGIINLIGRVFMTDLVDCPFRCFDRLIENELRELAIRVVDFHAEATSEKVAFGYYADGRASVVVGTHTHVQTADERLLPNHTAYITDAGMCGPYDGVIGVSPGLVVERFLSGLPVRFDVAKGAVMINGIVADVNDDGRAESIERVRRIYHPK